MLLMLRYLEKMKRDTGFLLRQYNIIALTNPAGAPSVPGHLYSSRNQLGGFRFQEICSLICFI